MLTHHSERHEDVTIAAASPASPRAPLKKGGRFVAVDAARGIAAGVVFFHHLFRWFPITWHALLGSGQVYSVFNFISNQRLRFVLLFFVISGFCIRAATKRADLGRAPDIRDYARRRLARILPLFLFSLLLAWVVGYFMQMTDLPEFSRRTLVGNLLFLQSAEGKGNWFLPYGRNGVLWSLSYEMFFYLVFPIIEIMTARSTRPSPMRSLAIALVFSGLSFVVFQIHPNPIALFGSLYVVWRLGACAYDVIETPQRAREVLIATIAAVVAMTAFTHVRSSDTVDTMRDGMAVAIFWLAMQSSLLARRSLNSRVVHTLVVAFAWLGSISYALYILHLPLILLGSNYLGDTPSIMVITSVAAVLLSYVAERAALYIQMRLLAR